MQGQTNGRRLHIGIGQAKVSAAVGIEMNPKTNGCRHIRRDFFNRNRFRNIGFSFLPGRCSSGCR